VQNNSSSADGRDHDWQQQQRQQQQQELHKDTADGLAEESHGAAAAAAAAAVGGGEGQGGDASKWSFQQLRQHLEAQGRSHCAVFTFKGTVLLCGASTHSTSSRGGAHTLPHSTSAPTVSCTTQLATTGGHRMTVVGYQTCKLKDRYTNRIGKGRPKRRHQQEGHPRLLMSFLQVLTGLSYGPGSASWSPSHSLQSPHTWQPATKPQYLAAPLARQTAVKLTPAPTATAAAAAAAAAASSHLGALLRRGAPVAAATAAVAAVQGAGRGAGAGRHRVCWQRCTAVGALSCWGLMC
jgi:hypothetical protein